MTRALLRWARAALVLMLVACGGTEKVETAPDRTACTESSVCSPFKCGSDGFCLEACDFDQDCARGFICAKDKFAIEGRCGTNPNDARPKATDQ